MAEACCDEDDYPPFEEWALNGKLGDLADIVATLYKARSNAIDPSRILKDGERAVSVEELEALRELLAHARVAAHEVEDNGKCDMSAICDAVQACDALRSGEDGEGSDTTTKEKRP